ncbi:MAG: polyprenyl synthetase family protein [Actinomycetota bacterium]
MRQGIGHEPGVDPPTVLGAVRKRVDDALRDFLARRRLEISELDANAAGLVDELIRLMSAGGKRIRPAFCYWGFRAAGGAETESIIRAAAALELLHTFALIHDDVMDGSEVRRGVASSHVHLARERATSGPAGDPRRYGLSVAILAGDLGAVLAERMFLDSGFAPDVLLPAFHRYDRMRVEMAVGQYLDVGGAGKIDRRLARRVASLKTGSYTVEGPLQIGAALAGASLEVMADLSGYGVPLGEAFQLRDDMQDAGDDGEDAPATDPHGESVNALVEQACAAIEGSPLVPAAVEALRSLARLIAVPG